MAEGAVDGQNRVRLAGYAFTLGVAGAGLNAGAVGQFPAEVVELGEDGQFPILFGHCLFLSVCGCSLRAASCGAWGAGLFRVVS